MNRKERDRQLRRSDILKAAEHIFALRGYHKATIRAIAKAAQYASGTVYLHFKDKEDLYFALFEEKIRCLLSMLAEKIPKEGGEGNKLKAFVEQSLSFFEQNQDFFRIYISEGDILLSEVKILKSSISQQFKSYTERLIKQAQDQGVISRDFSSRQATEVFFAILKTVVVEWLKTGSGSLVNLSGIILRYFLNGTAK